MFRNSPVKRTKYLGFLRNVAIAMKNSGEAKFGPLLERLGPVLSGLSESTKVG